MGNGLGGGTNKKFREVHMILFWHLFSPSSGAGPQLLYLHIRNALQPTGGRNLGTLQVEPPWGSWRIGVGPWCFSEKSLGDTLGTAGGRHLWGDHLVRAYQAVLRQLSTLEISEDIAAFVLWACNFLELKQVKCCNRLIVCLTGVRCCCMLLWN